MDTRLLKLLGCAGALLGPVVSAQAQSFSVDANTIGRLGSAVSALAPTSDDVFNSVTLPGGGVPGLGGFSGTNRLDTPGVNLGVPIGVARDVNALSAGWDPLDFEHTWDLLFSVDPFSVGRDGPAPGRSQVNVSSAAGRPVGAELYFTNPQLMTNVAAGAPTNRMLPFFLAPDLGLDAFAPLENVDALEVWDQVSAGNEVPYPGFDRTGDDVFYSLAGVADIFRAPQAGPAGATVLFQPGAAMGLGFGDDLDAMILDALFTQTQPVGAGNDGIDEAIFSLAPSSPSLWGNDGAPGVAGVDDDGNGIVDDLAEVGLGDDWSAADLFYTDFTGGFRLAVTGDINFGAVPMAGFPAIPQNIAFTAENLGLLATDNVDGLDLAATGTVANLPAFGGNAIAYVPEPATLALLAPGVLLMAGGVLCRRSGRRRR